MEKIIPQQIIKNSDLVLSYFGYWPTFHDDEIEEVLNNSKERSLKVKIKSKIRTEKGNECLITFLFKRVKNLNLEYYVDVDLKSDIIFEVRFKKLENDLIQTCLDPSVGMHCIIDCEKIEIEALEIIN